MLRHQWLVSPSTCHLNSPFARQRVCCSYLAAQKRLCSVACLPSHVTAVTHAVVSCRYRPLNSYFKQRVVAYTSHFFFLFLSGCSYYSPVLSAATWQPYDSLIYSHLRRSFLADRPTCIHFFFIFIFFTQRAHDR